MKGVFSKLKWRWPARIEHNHSDPNKELRYQVGSERLQFLKNFSQDFAYEEKDDAETLAAYLVKLEEGDLDSRMPKATRYEYVCGKVAPCSFILFSYQWFNSLQDAKAYALRKNMTILGGWNEK